MCTVKVCCIWNNLQAPYTSAQWTGGVDTTCQHRRCQSRETWRDNLKLNNKSLTNTLLFTALAHGSSYMCVYSREMPYSVEKKKKNMHHTHRTTQTSPQSTDSLYGRRFSASPSIEWKPTKKERQTRSYAFDYLRPSGPVTACTYMYQLYWPSALVDRKATSKEAGPTPSFVTSSRTTRMSCDSPRCTSSKFEKTQLGLGYESANCGESRGA